MHEEILATERSLWTNDADLYAATFLPEAILIFPIVGRIELQDAVKAIRSENESGRYWSDVEFSDEATLSIAPDIVLLSYRAAARWNDRAEPEHVLCTTLYLRRGGGWRIASHQQTDHAGGS